MLQINHAILINIVNNRNISVLGASYIKQSSVKQNITIDYSISERYKLIDGFSSSASSISLHDVQINEEDMKYISYMLAANHQIKIMKFSHDYLGIENLAKFIEGNTTLKKITIRLMRIKPEFL